MKDEILKHCIWECFTSDQREILNELYLKIIELEKKYNTLYYAVKKQKIKKK